MNKLITLMALLFCSLTQLCIAQQGELTGKVIDANTKESLPFTNVYIEVEGLPRGAQTDFDGFYSIKPIPAGIYALTIEYIGYKKQVVDSIEIKADEITTVDINLIEDSSSLDEVVIMEYSVPTASSRVSKAAKSAADLPTRKTTTIEATGAGVYTEGADLSLKGARGDKPAKRSNLHSQLTAGEVHDFSKWEMWEDISANDLAMHQKTWNINPKERFAFQLMNEQKVPLVDRNVVLKNKSGELLWEARTDNFGKAELWLNMFTNTEIDYDDLLIEVAGRETFNQVFSPTNYKQGINYMTLEEDCHISNKLDVMLVVDATGSMRDEISYLQSDFINVMDYIKADKEDFNIRVGSVFYRDETDEYLVRSSDLTEDFEVTANFMNEQHAGGGGDFPEALDDAMLEAIEKMSWSENAVARVIFLLADAPPHKEKDHLEKVERLTTLAASKGIRIIPVASSGIDKNTEYLMRSMALATNGTYTFLTDDSGIGNPHIKPTTDSYEVEKLNDLITRLINQYTSVTNCNEAQKTDDTKQTTTIIEERQQLKVYPNPAVNAVNVKLNHKADVLNIVDINGKLLIQKTNLHKGKIRLDLNALPVGTYIVSVQTKDKVNSAKLVVVRK